MVVAGRLPVFGEIVGSTKTGGETPHLKPSPLGLAVLNNEIPKIHHYYPMVAVWQVCLMPDHLHMIVRINAPLPEGKHLGIIIGAFKGGVSRAWWRLTEEAVKKRPPPTGLPLAPSERRGEWPPPSPLRKEGELEKSENPFPFEWEGDFYLFSISVMRGTICLRARFSEV